MPITIKAKLEAAAKEGDWGAIENLIDTGIRHKEAKPEDYLRHWLEIGRCFGYATKDGSWGEFEKEFTIIVTRMLKAEKKLEKESS